MVPPRRLEVLPPDGPVAAPPHRVDPLLSAEQIALRVEELAVELSLRTEGEIVLVALLKGALVFTADLMRALARQGRQLRLELVKLASYGSGTVSSGEVRVDLDLREGVRGRDVVLLDDILDTGRTLVFAQHLLEVRGARSVTTVVLMDKPSRRVEDVQADLVGFEIPDAFVVGYGIDWDERYRERPDIGIVVFCD